MTLVDQITQAGITSYQPMGIVVGTLYQKQLSPSLAVIGLIWPYLPEWANAQDPDRRFFPEREITITHYNHKYGRECVHRVTLSRTDYEVNHAEPYAVVVSDGGIKLFVSQTQGFFKRVRQIQRQMY